MQYQIPFRTQKLPQKLLKFRLCSIQSKFHRTLSPQISDRPFWRFKIFLSEIRKLFPPSLNAYYLKYLKSPVLSFRRDLSFTFKKCINVRMNMYLYLKLVTKDWYYFLPSNKEPMNKFALCVESSLSVSMSVATPSAKNQPLLCELVFISIGYFRSTYPRVSIKRNLFYESIY